jgi:DnaK suppressor protein
MALSEEQRRHLEKRLHEERNRVLRILRRSDETRDASETERSGDISSLPFHLADIGTETYEQEMSMVFAQRASDELEAIDEALRRFYETPGRYGICEDTGEPIPFERLDLIPWARTCGERDTPGGG